MVDWYCRLIKNDGVIINGIVTPYALCRTREEGRVGKEEVWVPDQVDNI